MNIFVLDKNPVLAAKYNCDKHCVKMILEAGQMLCVAHWIGALRSVNKELGDFKRVREAKWYAEENADPSLIPPWTLTHTRHPCTIWTSENTGNYMWHVQLMRSLLDEYTLRYEKTHKSVPNDPVAAYRNYYHKYKAYMAKWNKGATPSWWQPETEE